MLAQQPLLLLMALLGGHLFDRTVHFNWHIQSELCPCGVGYHSWSLGLASTGWAGTAAADSPVLCCCSTSNLGPACCICAAALQGWHSSSG